MRRSSLDRRIQRAHLYGVRQNSRSLSSNNRVDRERTRHKDCASLVSFGYDRVIFYDFDDSFICLRILFDVDNRVIVGFAKVRTQRQGHLDVTVRLDLLTFI